MRLVRIFAPLALILSALFGVPWLVLIKLPEWPTPIFAAASAGFALALLTLPAAMVAGHGRRRIDRAAAVGVTLLGVIWVLFAWSLLILLLQLALADMANPARSRIIAVLVLAVVVVLLAWGYREAMRLPRTRTLNVVIPRLGPGMDGLRVVVITDTHFGPIDRTNWCKRVVAAVNELKPDVVCHVGDLADGTVARRREQVDPLGDIEAGAGRFYVTGNHEYFGEAQGWLDHMRRLGWEPLHNRHTVLERGGSRLAIAGINDRTGRLLPGHGPDLVAALAGVDPESPVVLLAHQPKQVAQTVASGVDLQLSGHTHGGQIWPFRYLVRLDQPVVSGLSRHGNRTQLYTSRGTGFWGPPLRIFAPSEITVLTLRCGI